MTLHSAIASPSASLLSLMLKMASELPATCAHCPPDDPVKPRAYTTSALPDHIFPEPASAPRPSTAVSISQTAARETHARLELRPLVSRSDSESSASVRSLALDSLPSAPAEVFLLASPPPRRGQNRSLIFQIQRVSGRRVIPVFDLKRQSSGAKKQLQYTAYSCEEDKRTSILHAANHQITFGHSSDLSWSLRSEASGAGLVVVASSERDGSRRVGRWTPAITGTASPTSWDFVIRGEVIASLRGNKVEIRPAAREISRRKGFLGCVRFEEALVFSAAFITGINVFGRPPQLSDERGENSPPPVARDASPATGTLSRTAKSLSMPIEATAAKLSRERHLSRLTGGLIRRGRSLLLRKSLSPA